MVSSLPRARPTVPTEVSKDTLLYTHVEANNFYFQEIQCCRKSVCEDLFAEFLQLLWTLQVAFDDFVFSKNNVCHQRNSVRETKVVSVLPRKDLRTKLLSRCSKYVFVYTLRNEKG